MTEDADVEYTPDDALMSRLGVYSRPLFELVSDMCWHRDEPEDQVDGVRGAHDTCLSRLVAARWPDPYRFHDLGPDLKVVKDGADADADT